MDSAIDRSLCAFEDLHRMLVTVHDLDGSLAGLLDPQRTRHRHPLCTLMKDGPAAARCYRWEVDDLRPRIGHLAGGRIQRCHAGLVEWVMPIRSPGGQTRGLCFAGPRRWAGRTDGLIDSMLRPMPGSEALEPVDGDQARQYLEALAQLAARIEQHLQDLARSTTPAPRDRLDILQLYLRHHAHEGADLAGLAQRWGVSRSRAGHLTRELTGHSWSHLVQEQRLRHACQLLHATDLPIPIIAERSGFGDRVFFTRVFRRKFQTTPGRWRRSRA